MKRIFEAVDLTGQIEEISMMDLRKRPGEVLTGASLGKTYIIKRGQIRLAVLMKLPGERLTIEIKKDGSISYK